MKTRMLTFVATFLFVSLTLNGQQAEKTLVKAFNLQGSQNVFLDFDGPIQVQEWSQDQMRVMMTISLTDGSEMMLKNLVQVGRYNLSSEETETGMKIFAPGLEKQVKLRNGSELQENISMVVYAPSKVIVSSRTSNQPTVSPDSN